MAKNNFIFCEKCGKQFTIIDEVEECICQNCISFNKEMNEHEAFFCWACGKQLIIMSEIAQGVCHNCKLSIIRKLNPTFYEKIINLILSDAAPSKNQ